MNTDTIARGRRTRTGTAAVALLMAIGSSTPLGAQVHPAGQDHATSVRVDNTRSVPVTVYLERGLFDLRLGIVTAHSVETLALPSEVTSSETIRIVVHPAGGRDLTTPDLRVKRGGTLHVYVPTNDEGFLPAPPAERIPDPGPGTTTLTVENAHNRMVTVFIDQGPFDMRIGSVPANQEVTFQLPESIVRAGRSVQIFVHPERGNDLASQTLEVRRGAHLLVKVPR